jgi:hypothetical protein
MCKTQKILLLRIRKGVWESAHEAMDMPIGGMVDTRRVYPSCSDIYSGEWWAVVDAANKQKQRIMTAVDWALLGICLITFSFVAGAIDAYREQRQREKQQAEQRKPQSPEMRLDR